MNDMARQEAFDSPICYGDFRDDVDFLDWVATYHGVNVSATCRVRLEEAKKAGQRVHVVDDILKGVTRATRQIDLAKNNFRARFSW
jgi:hypothetical protein